LESQFIELHGGLTLPDLIRFQYFHVCRRIRLFALCFGILVPLLFISQLQALFTGRDVGNVWGTAAPLLFLMGLWGLLPYWGAKRQIRNQSYLAGPCRYDFDSGGIRMAGANHSWSMAWNLTRRVCETRRLYIVYHAPNIGLVIPKRLFRDDAEITRWREFVQQCIAPRSIEPPGLVGRWF
jgi:hypothetical protein